MATKTNAWPKPGAGSAGTVGTAVESTPTIEDRLAKLESDKAAQLTENEVTGLRALLDRSGFDREKGTF